MDKSIDRLLEELARLLRQARASNFQIREPQIERLLSYLARSIKAALPQGWGFMLFFFTLGEGGSMFYISDAQRADVIQAMKEWIALQEGGGKA